MKFPYRQTRLHALYELELALASIVDLQGRLKLLLEHTLVQMRADIGVVFLIDSVTNDLVVFAQRGARNADAWHGFHLKIGEGAGGWIAQHGEPLAIPDVQGEPRWMRTDASDGEDIVSYLGVPLGIKGQIIGVLDVATRTRREFTVEEIEFFATLASRAALAIQNARLLEETCRRAEELTAITRVSRDITSTPDLMQVLTAVARHAAELSRSDASGVFAFRPDGYLHIEAAYGVQDEFMQTVNAEGIPLGRGAIGRAAASHLPVQIPDILTEMGYPFNYLAEMEHVRAILAVPMLRGEEVVGGIVLWHRQPRQFAPQEVAFVQALAQQSVNAVENARLFEAHRRRALQLEIIRQISQKINAVLDPEALFVQLAQQIQQQLGYDNVSLWLGEDASGEITLQAGTRKPGKPLLDRHLRLKIGEGITGWVAQNGEPLLVNDIRLEPRFFGDQEKAPRSELCVPIKAGDRVIGVMGFQKYPVNAFGQEDLFLAQTLADQVAIALENARLFKGIRLYKNAFNSAADAVVFTDLQGHILDVNLSFEQLTGYGRAEAIGQKMSIVKSQHSTRSFYQKMWSQILNEGYWTGEIINLRKNGEEWNSWTTISTVKDEQGQPVAYVGANRDITALKQAEAALRRRAEELALVNQISSVINQPLALKDVLASTLRELTYVLDVDRGAVAIFAPSRDHLTVIAEHDPHGGPSSLGRTIPLRDNPSMEYILRERRPLAVADVPNDPILDSITPLLRELGIQSLLFVPLIAQDQVIGTIGLDSVRRRRIFNEDEITLAQTIAHQAAAAIEKARLFDAERTRRSELGALYDLSRSLADATYDFDAILDLITHRAVETIHVTFARIALVEDGECVIRAAYPVRVLERDLGVGHRETVHTLPTCSRVAQQNTPVVLQCNDPALTNTEREALFLGLAQTLCLVPLRASERVLGLLMLGEARRGEREPFTPEKIRLARSIGDQAASALRRAELFAELEQSYLQTVLTLANAVDAKDTYTANHAQRLAEMALAIGHEMELSPRELEDLRYGAILHDIGKIGIPDSILKKPSKLEADEWKVMHQHPDIGARILAPVPRLAGAARIVRHHHERYDGKGYPDGLAAEAIPLAARILTVVDSYSAIVDSRVYKPPRSRAEAIAELKKHAGAQFDPRIVKTFLRILKRGLV